MRRLTVAVLAVLALVTLAAPAASARAKGTDRPLKGAQPVTVTLVLTATGAVAHGEGTFHLSHLGRGDVSFDVVVVNGVAANPFSGTITYTAANGDVLTGTVTGSTPNDPTACVICPGAVLPSTTGTIVFTGGTGRFADATGSASIVAPNLVQSFDPATFTIVVFEHTTIRGSISY